MAFTHLGVAGSAIPKTAGATATLTPTRTLAVGEFAVLSVAWDVDLGVTGNTTTLSVTDTGTNTWTRRGEVQLRGGSLNGVKAGLFTSVLTTSLTTASTITVTDSSSAVPVAKALQLRSFSIAGGNIIQVAVSTGATTPPQTASSTNSGGGTVRCPGGTDELVAAALGRLWIGVHAAETTVTTGVADADYTHTEIKTTAGADASNVRVRGSYRLSTVTNDSYSFQTGATNTDHAAILTVFDEITPVLQTITSTGGLDSGAALGTATLTIIADQTIRSPALAVDSFTRANSNDLGTAWDVVPGFAALKILTNQVEGSSTSCESNNTVTWPADHSSQVTVWRARADRPGIGPAVRCSTTVQSAYLLVINEAVTDNVKLYKCVTGSFTQLWQRTAPVLTPGDGLRLEVEGTTLRAYKNGVQVGADHTDTAIASGRAGIGNFFTTTDNNLADDWEGGAPGTGSIDSSAAYGTATLVLVQTITATALASSAATGIATLTAPTSVGGLGGLWLRRRRRRVHDTLRGRH